jgi:hypothetical protein
MGMNTLKKIRNGTEVKVVTWTEPAANVTTFQRNELIERNVCVEMEKMQRDVVLTASEMSRAL